MTQSSLVKKKIQGKMENWTIVLFGFFVFVCFYVYFTKIHPLYILDLDDWLYIYFSRPGIPDVNEWNPGRVLPEIWMTLTSYLGSFFIFPLTGDLIQSLTMAYAAMFAFMIVCYTLVVGKVLKNRFHVGSGENTALMTAFLLGHFLPFMTGESNNAHLFSSGNVTCVFYYTLPALWNFILCCVFLAEKEKIKSPLLRGLLYLAIYLAIFSNLFQSIILMSLFGIRLLFALVEGIWQNCRRKKTWICWRFLKTYLSVHYEKILWILAWFLCMLFEISGGRSGDYTDSLALGNTLQVFKDSLLNIHTYFWYGVVLINLLAVASALWHFFCYREGKFLYWQTELLACMGLTAVFLILLCAKVSPDYMQRPDVMISWMGWLMLMTVSSGAYLLKKIPKTAYLLPMLIFLLLTETVLDEKTYEDYFVSDIGAATVKAVNDDIILQVVNAENQGLKEVQVYVPESLANGWPLDTYLTPSRISDALWHHGVTDKKIKVTIVPSKEKDVQFNLE